MNYLSEIKTHLDNVSSSLWIYHPDCRTPYTIADIETEKATYNKIINLIAELDLLSTDLRQHEKKHCLIKKSKYDPIFARLTGLKCELNKNLDAHRKKLAFLSGYFRLNCIS